MEQQARAEWGGVVGGSPSEPQILNPTATDTDGDGIPDTWENANGLQFYNPKDALSDFDMDGLTALQEYQLSQSTSGQFGKPLGKWTAQLLPKPAGFSPVNPNVTLIECASNGIILAQVSGKLTGSSVTTTYPYIYAPATGTWTRIAAPDGFPSVNGLFGLDINSSGRVVGYFNVFKGFIWTPGLDGGRTEVFQLDTLDGLVSAIPKRIGDSGHVIGTVGNLDGRSFAARPDRTEIQFSGDWAEPLYHDVNEFGEFVGTVFNPVSLRQETFLACEGFPIFMTGLVATDFDNIYPWIEIPVIDPDSIDWGESESGWQSGLVMDQRTGDLVWVATDIIGADPLWWATGYIPGDGPPSYVRQFPGFSHLIGAVNDWGEFAGKFTGSMGGIELDENGYIIGGADESASGLFFFDGSFHGTDQSSLIYGVSNDSQVLIGTPYAVWSGSSLVPVSKLLPAGVSSYITRARIADHGQLILQIGTSIYYLKPNQDADGDSMPDDWEKYYGFDPNNASDAEGDPDQDGISNYAEFKFRTNPQMLPVPGSPGQFIDIRPGIDTDGDGLPNVFEWKYHLDYNNASDALTDTDNDGLTNLQEFRLGTKISGLDSDGDGVSDWDEIMVNFTNPLSAADNDHDGIAEDFEKHLAKQLLEFQPDPLVWGIFYAGIMTGDLDANHDYTGEGRTLGEYAVLRLEPWSSISAETESRMTATLYGETGIIQTTSGGVTETRAVGSFAHGWYNGAPSTDMTTTLVPNAAWYISKTELLPWDARYMTAFNPNSPSSSIRLSHNIQITTDRNTTKTLYPGRYEQKRIRIWGPKIANAPVTYHYLIITQRTKKSFDAYPSTTISAVPVKLEIKNGQSSSDWLEIKPTLDSNQDHSYVVSLLPVDIEPDADMAGVIGDVVKSAKEGSTIKHFVTPKKSAELNQNYVILKATGITAEQITFGHANQIVEWDGGESVPNEPLKRRVKRDATGSGATEVMIKVKQGGAVAVQMKVWVTWATLKNLDGPETRIRSVELVEGMPGVKFRARVKWEYECEPKSMFVATEEVPLLAIPPGIPAPGGNHPWTAQPLSEGANMCYDASRQVRVVTRSNDLILNQALQNGGPDVMDYPASSTEGNDDPNTNRERDPFGVYPGIMEDADLPEFPLKDSTASSNPNATILSVAQFKQFARFQTGRRWYRCSAESEGLSTLTFKLKRADGKWVDDGSSYILGNGVFPPP